nr:hypothetical protein [Saprospira grandis]
MLLLFWGCPALRAGRAVSQLAGLLGPAGFFASLQKPWVCRLRRPCFPSLSRPRFAPLWRQAASPCGAKTLFRAKKKPVHCCTGFID